MWCSTVCESGCGGQTARREDKPLPMLLNLDEAVTERHGRFTTEWLYRYRG